jgi:hypothetical protein
MLFTRNRRRDVSNFVLKLVNTSNPDLLSLKDGPRTDKRVNLTVVVLVVPLEKKRVDVTKAFHAVTKDFSSTSVSVMIDSARHVHDAILAFRFEGEMYFIRAKAKHVSPLGGGFHQLGFQMDEIVSPIDYPGLSDLSF